MECAFVIEITAFVVLGPEALALLIPVMLALMKAFNRWGKEG